MSRVQLALNVTDIDASVVFYSKLFGAEPAKREPGYANFVVADPPLKLVLVEAGGRQEDGPVGALNHVGVEVGSADEVVRATTQLTAAGLDTHVQGGTTCCFAVQDKVWVSDPDGVAWEVYTVLADAPSGSGVAGDGTGCSPGAGEGVAVAPGATPAARCC